MKCFFLAVLSLVIAHTTSFGQVTITELMTGNGIDWTGFEAVGTAGDNFGLVPGGNSGKSLDSNNWRFEGYNTGASTSYGDSRDGGKFRRGTDTGGVGSAGIWAFDVSNGGTVDRALGLQLKDNTFTPGIIELLVENNTGATVNELKFIYDLYEYNDQSDGIFTLDFEVEGKGNIPGMSYTTTDAASVSPEWVLNAQDAIVSGLNWADGDTRYLRWNLSTVETELFDEIAIDNIRVAAIPEPSTYALIFGGFAVGLVVFMKRRRDSRVSI